jgi:hypothetical protein
VLLLLLPADSWGSGNAEYDFQSSRVDAWLHRNQDCVSHFAAGNYGESDNLDTTITSPAVAKNVVTVGATKSLQPNYLSQTIAPVFLMSVEVKRASKAAQYISVRLVKADFGGDGTALSGKGLKMVRASPPTACGSLDDAASGKYKDAIVLARRGTCFFSQKMSAGTAAGAAAVVVVNDRCVFVVATCPFVLNYSSVLMYAFECHCLRQLTNWRGLGQPGYALQHFVAAAVPNQNRQNLHRYASHVCSRAVPLCFACTFTMQGRRILQDGCAGRPIRARCYTHQSARCYAAHG